MSQDIKHRVRVIGPKFGITDIQQLLQVQRAILEGDQTLIKDLLVPKKWKQLKTQIQQFQPSPSKNLLFFRKPISGILQSSSLSCKAIIMGPCGNGKTTTVNHICGSSLLSGDSQSSLTKNITQLKSQFYYPSPFIIYDTPGTTAHIEKLEHAMHLKCLLQYKPVNSICILVKFDGRYDQLLKNMYRQVLMLQGYEENIVFLVSHMDLAKKPQQAIKKVDDLMLYHELKNQVIFYSNQSMNPKVFSDALYSICSKMKQVQIKIVQKVFYKYFNLKKQPSDEAFFKKSQKQAIQQMDFLTQCYQKEVELLPDDEQRYAKAQDMLLSLKNQLCQQIDFYANKLKDALEPYQYYTSFYTLQLKSNDCVESFQNKIKHLQKYNFLESTATGTKLEIQDLIKQCPNPKCGLVWFRIQACPNTVCGARPSCTFDFMKKSLSRYRIKIDRKSRRLKIEKDENHKELTEQSKLNVEERKKRSQIGCNQAMNFETLPRLQNIETILKQWYNVQTMEEVILRFNRDEKIEKARKEIERKINISFLGFSF